MPKNECDNCGLAECDIPDGFDPDLLFETEDGVTLCQGCEIYRDPERKPPYW